MSKADDCQQQRLWQLSSCESRYIFRVLVNRLSAHVMPISIGNKTLSVFQATTIELEIIKRARRSVSEAAVN